MGEGVLTMEWGGCGSGAVWGCYPIAPAGAFSWRCFELRRVRRGRERVLGLELALVDGEYG